MDQLIHYRYSLNKEKDNEKRTIQRSTLHNMSLGDNNFKFCLVFLQSFFLKLNTLINGGI